MASPDPPAAPRKPAARPKPPPLSNRVVVVAAAVLGLTVAAIVIDTRRVRTGELLVQADRGDVRVAIRKGGRLVVLPTGNRSFTLLPGDYSVELEGSPPGLRVVPARVSVARNTRSVVRVEQASVPASPSLPGATPEPGERG
jgi:hypothetical protein